MSIYHSTELFFHWEEDTIQKVEETPGSCTYYVQFPCKCVRCPECGAETRSVKDYRKQVIYLGVFNNTHCYANVRKRRYFCAQCKHAFFEKIPGVRRYQRRSQSVQEAIIDDCLKTFSFSEVAYRFNVSVTTVLRYFSFISPARPQTLPEVISIDEFRGNAHGQKYQVLITDPEKKEVLDVLPRRQTDDIIKYFLQFSHAIRAKVKFVIMDLSPIFRKAIETVFPHAVIIGDRFHIFRTVFNSMENVRKRVQKNMNKKGIAFKRSKYLFAKNMEDINEEDSIRLSNLLFKSKDLRYAYYLKECFHRILKMKDEASVKEFLDEWLSLIAESGLPEFKHILRSFSMWRNEIVEGILRPYSNGYIEGVNNRIKVIKRISFGLRNFDRFRTRIMCCVFVSKRKTSSSSEDITA